MRAFRACSPSAWVLLVALGFLTGVEQAASAQSLAAPRPKEDFDIRLPLFEQATLANGLTVYSYQDDSLPLVAVGLAVRTGSVAEPADKAGLSYLAYRMLAERAEDDGLEGGESFARLGSRLGIDHWAEGGMLGLYVMSSQGERAVATLASLVQQVQADPAQLARLKSRLLVSYELSLGSPRVLASNHMLRLLYGAQHPYGHVLTGTLESMKAITPQDVEAFYACSFVPKNVALVVSGPPRGATVREWAARYFGAWQSAGQTCDGPVPSTTTPKRTQIIAIAKPGLAQSIILIGRAMVPLGHKDEQALSLAVGCLGSNVTYELRRKKAITYGVSMQLPTGLYGGHFLLSAQVQADKTGEALRETLSEMFAAQRDPVSARLVISNRLSRAWGLMSAYDSLGSSIAHVGLQFVLRQPLSQDQLTLERLKRVGPNDVDAARYRYIEPSTMQIVVAGDPDVIRKQVAPLKLGTLRWGQPDGSLTDAP